VPKQVTEYAIQWSGPEEVQGTITVMGTGQFNKDKALLYLEMYGKLPGEMTGRVVQRTITWSEWEGVTDGSDAYLPRPAGFWEIHPGL
jgi:hypothetical protein